MELSGMLSDEDLWNLIEKCTVPIIKDLLSKGNIPHSGVNKPELQMRLFYSIRLGLPIVPTEEENEERRQVARKEKLNIGQGVVLVHPLQLDDWEGGPNWNFPDITADKVKDYFVSCNSKQGIETGGHKALKEGRSISASDGWVSGIKYHAISPVLGLCYISGMVRPQTRINDRPYLVWCTVYKNTGVIHRADCHCIAGLSGTCKHVAALLYATVDLVKMGHNLPSTSKLQTWHQPSKKLKSSAFIEDISTPKSKPHMEMKRKNRRDHFDPRPMDFQHEKSLGDYNLDTLSTVTNGKAAILIYANIFRHEDPIGHPPDINIIEDVTEVNTSTNITCYTVQAAAQKYEILDDALQLMTVTPESREWLASITQGQGTSQMWHDHRQGRITASVVGKVMSHVAVNGHITGSTYSLTATILGYYHSMDDHHLPKSIEWGKKNEEKALKLYQQQQGGKHVDFCCSSTGLWISADHPYLAATPDSLVHCACCGSGVVEVKNPFTHRMLSITDFSKQPGSFLLFKEGQYCLDQCHDYYAQVQCQILCVSVDFCDFVTVTESMDDNMVVIRIPKNDHFIAGMIEKYSAFFGQVIFPEIKMRTVQKEVSMRYLEKEKQKKM